jgi:hypothetical protein
MHVLRDYDILKHSHLLLAGASAICAVVGLSSDCASAWSVSLDYVDTYQPK